MDLNIDYDETISVGQQVNAKTEKFKDLLSTINTTNENLKNAWEGTDATKYTDAVASQAKVMNELADTMNEIGNFLQKVGKAYKEAMEANASAINR